MATKIFTFYNLKEGVDIEKFKEWSRRVDQPTCNSMPACHKFEVFVIKGESSKKPFYMIAEDIDVESWDAWQDTIQSKEFSRVMEEWPLYGDSESVVSVYCEKI